MFFPATAQEILDLGIHAFAMSRFSGVWAGMKTIQEIVESSATVMIDPQRVQIKIPTDFPMPPGGVHIRWPDAALDQEARLFDTKWYAALAYIRANRLNYHVISAKNDRPGLIARGRGPNHTPHPLGHTGPRRTTCHRSRHRSHPARAAGPAGRGHSVRADRGGRGHDWARWACLPGGRVRAVSSPGITHSLQTRQSDRRWRLSHAYHLGGSRGALADSGRAIGWHRHERKIDRGQT